MEDTTLFFEVDKRGCLQSMGRVGVGCALHFLAYQSPWHLGQGCAC